MTGDHETVTFSKAQGQRISDPFPEVNACAKALDVDRAEKWLQEMPQHNVQPDDVSYSTVIHACGTAQEPERAEQWMKLMISSLSSQGEKPGSFCYNSIAQAWVPSWRCGPGHALAVRSRTPWGGSVLCELERCCKCTDQGSPTQRGGALVLEGSQR